MFTMISYPNWRASTLTTLIDMTQNRNRISITIANISAFSKKKTQKCPCKKSSIPCYSTVSLPLSLQQETSLCLDEVGFVGIFYNLRYRSIYICIHISRPLKKIHI